MPFFAGGWAHDDRRITADDLEELERKAALWDKHEWRAQVHLVRRWIEIVGGNSDWPHETRASSIEDLPYTEYLAHAFVHTARELKLPLKVAVAIAEKESKFNQAAVGKAGEVSLMQVKPFADRPMTRIRDTAAFAIRWALQNCFYPAYKAALSDGKTELEAIRQGLIRYNGEAYATEALALMKNQYADPLWQEAPR